MSLFKYICNLIVSTFTPQEHKPENTDINPATFTILIDAERIADYITYTVRDVVLQQIETAQERTKEE